MSYEKLDRHYMITSPQTISLTQSQSHSESQSQYQTEQHVHNRTQLNPAQNPQPNPPHLNEFDLHSDIEQPACKYYVKVNASSSHMHKKSNSIIFISV